MAKQNGNGGVAVIPAKAVGDPTNDGQTVIDLSKPYIATVTIEGTAAILFHRWSVDGVEAKGKAAKGSEAKKSDDVESYLYRDSDKDICLPGEYLRGAIIHAAKYKQDPRSPRKSAMDIFKAGVVTLDELCKLKGSDGKTFQAAEYLDRRRVQIQRNGITRSRPAFHAGWKCDLSFMCNLPEYIQPALLNEVIQSAGRLIGVADFRPTFGRFAVVKFDVVSG